jgi:hypothetical protein
MTKMTKLFIVIAMLAATGGLLELLSRAAIAGCPGGVC